MTQHTPTPWNAENAAGDFQALIYGVDDPTGKTIALTYTGNADAEFIVRACNAHDELVDACRAFVSLWPVLPGYDKPKATPEVITVWNMAKQALAKAEEV